MKREKIWSAGIPSGARPAAQMRRPDQQEEGELQDDRHAGADHGNPRVAERPGGEESLHDQLIGAVRGRREERAADESAEQGVGLGEAERPD